MCDRCPTLMHIMMSQDVSIAQGRTLSMYSVCIAVLCDPKQSCDAVASIARLAQVYEPFIARRDPTL